MKHVCLALSTLLLLSCSVYTSSGRKKFEEDTPKRVPIAMELNCYNENPVPANLITEEIDLTESSNTFLINNQYLNKKILVAEKDNKVLLIIHRNGSDFCLTQAMSKTDYQNHKQALLEEVNTWP